MATFAEVQCLHGSAGSTGSTSAPTCSAVQINRKAADAWTHATLVYFTEGCWCESSQRNKLFIHKKGHVIQRRGAIGALRILKNGAEGIHGGWRLSPVCPH